MTPERQRIAIAEACGIKSVCNRCGHEQLCTTLTCQSCGMKAVEVRRNLPNYLSDLNAMHEAEKVITADRKISEYIRKLSYLSMESHLGTCHATAAQRAEAFLRTIGKWEYS